MNSTPNLYYPYHSNFGEQKGLEWMAEVTDDGAYRHTGLVPYSQPEPDQAWVSQQLEDLKAVRAHIDAKLRELHDLYRKQQDTLARLRTFNATTTTTTTSTSSFTTLPPVHTTTHMSHIHPSKNAFTYETSRQGEVTQHRESLDARKSHICQSCGKGYTRKDSLLRHATVHASENPYL